VVGVEELVELVELVVLVEMVEHLVVLVVILVLVEEAVGDLEQTLLLTNVVMEAVDIIAPLLELAHIMLVEVGVEVM
jgi:hypothetical protein